MSWPRLHLRPHVRPGLLLAFIALAEYAAPWRTPGRALTFLIALVLVGGFVRDSLRHVRLAIRVPGVIKERLFELGLTAIALALLASKAAVWVRALTEPGSLALMDVAYRQYAAAFLLVAGLRIVAGDWTVRSIAYRLDLKPAQTVALGFGGAILAGTVLLSLPLSVERLEALSLLDVLFTATSAVTVTGLSTYNPATYHTAFGQWVLLGLIQLGGLGTMVVSASLVVLAGRRLHLRRAAALQAALDVKTVGEVRHRVRMIFAVTAVSECLGAGILYLLWRDRPGLESPGFAAIFHAVSAFCNAGFSTFADSMQSFRDDLATGAVMAALILLGGIGFPVLSAGARWIAARRRGETWVRLGLHARLTLLTTAALLAAGAVGIVVLQWHASFAEYPWPSKVAVPMFLSVTARTAGFSTIPTESLAPAALWLLMLLMFIGGSPGSTAGGIKTTTVAIIGMTLSATLRGRARVEVFRRTIPDEQVMKALALFAVSLAMVAMGALGLLATQAADPLALSFEAVSAFGTVGLSVGVTPTLDAWGRAIVIVAMFVGRTGPLTLGFALAAVPPPRRITYPAEKVMIG